MQRCTWIIGLCVLVAGCDEKPAPLTFHPVRGEVTYNGQPAVGVRVYFYPTSAPMVPQIPANPHGVTGADGKFTIGTLSEADGAAEGGYQVILFWPQATPEGEEPSDTDRLFGWFDAKNSKLTFIVKSGANTLPAIAIPPLAGPPPESQGVPGRN